MAVEEIPQEEVTQLAGDPYSRGETRQSWVANALLQIEGNLRRVKSYKHLAQLRKAMANLNQMKKKIKTA